MTRGRVPSLVVGAFLFASLSLTGLSAQRPVFRAGVDLVQVDVSVTRGGRPVAGLTADNFSVTDNGAPQAISLAMRSDLPLRVAMTLDVSESVSGRRLQRLVEAGTTLNDQLRSGDQLSLITFSNEVRLRAPMGPPGPHIRRALAGLSGTGPTALFDAMHLALASEASQQVRSLVLLFSDGHDSSSWMPFEALLEAARRSSSVIHIVRLGRNELLDRLAEAAGGRTFDAGSEDDLKNLFTRALDEMRSRYVLTYTLPAGRTKGWHEIKVRLKDARGDITARPGYFVP